MPNAHLRLRAHGTQGYPQTSGLVIPCSARRAGAARFPLGTPCHGAASLLGKRRLCQSCCLPCPGPQPALLRSATWWPLSQAMSTREEPTSSSQTRGALEGRAPTVLTGCWDRHDSPCSISPSVVSLSPSSLWAFAGTSHTETTKDCAPCHSPGEQFGVPSAFIVPGPPLQSQHRHPVWHNSFGTAGYPSSQADQGCSRYFSSFLDSSTSEAGVFLGHEGVLQALQRMRKRMRMSNAMTQLKEIATIAPVERAAPMAAVPQESAGPTARSHAWDARAVMERAASTCRHRRGTKGTAVVLAVGWGWGQAGSRTVSPRQLGHSQLCPGLHHTTGKLSLGFPSSGRAVRAQDHSSPSSTWKRESHRHHGHEGTGCVSRSGWAVGVPGDSHPRAHAALLEFEGCSSS